MMNAQNAMQFESSQIWDTIKNELQGSEVKGKPMSYDTDDFGTEDRHTGGHSLAAFGDILCCIESPSLANFVKSTNELGGIANTSRHFYVAEYTLHLMMSMSKVRITKVGSSRV
jgi:hypothetical protein